MYANNRWYAWRVVVTGPAWSFESAVDIPSNSDLNNYKTPGCYKVSMASVATTITHGPITAGGYMLMVMNGSLAGVTMQMAFQDNGSVICIRYYLNSWGSWYKYTGTAIT